LVPSHICSFTDVFNNAVSTVEAIWRRKRNDRNMIHVEFEDLQRKEWYLILKYTLVFE
jgi:hypothetical protein